MSQLLWLKLKKYSKLENYIAFVQSTDLSKVPPLSRGDTKGLKWPDVPGLFTYLPIYDTLRQKYALDTAVRGNTDFERALSVMQWLTDNTWYSGAQYHLLRDEPLQILDYAYRQPFKNAINCRFKAIVLSDLLQAFGIPAYPIAMLDANKNGNHLTVHVYLKERKQWALFDPSFNTYFTGEDGKLFDAVTLRECFLSGKRPVIHGYAFNKTQQCRQVYEQVFIRSCLTNLTTWHDNSMNGRTTKKWSGRKQFDCCLPDTEEMENGLL